MPFSYVLDTFAWVEYLIGSRRGATVKEYVEGDPHFKFAENAIMI
jgi:hypothetical protein